MSNIETISQPLVSVVTPVYNAEKYLAECIESVLTQTYQNWELVVVNNCSTDRSLEIAQQYSNNDSRIRIHNNTKFLSLMQNWNYSICQISRTSKYCKVIHADDWLFPECIAKMVEVAEKNPSVGIVGSYRLDENRITLDGLPYPSIVVSGRQICKRHLLGDIYVFGSPSSILIRSEIIHKRNPFYAESYLHADKEACYDILKDYDFGFVHQVLTFTRRHNESVTSKSSRYNTRRIGRIAILKKYGPVYLSKTEYENRFKRTIKNYYRFLSRSIFELRDYDFWNYQKKELKKIGLSFSPAKLVKATIIESLDVKSVGKKMIRALQDKKKTKHAKRK
jgi:glycosyltransferase involved in cell wall biosynthesis